MKTNTLSAGARLRADLDAALARAGEELGHALEFDEAERHVSDQAAYAADRAEAAPSTAPSLPATPSRAPAQWWRWPPR